MIPESSRVQYVGEADPDLSIGDQGRVLSAAGTGSHVLWSTGRRAGEITLNYDRDLVVTSVEQYSYQDSLQDGELITISVRAVYDRQGSRGLLHAMADEGHLATFAPLAEQAIQHVASQLRQDPSMKAVLAHLEPEEGSEFISSTAVALLKDAL